MFSDKVRIFIKSGKGGDGHVSFRRELYVPAGGPDGGNGGHGGDIIFQVDKGLNTLGDFRHNSKYIAQSGEEGGKKRCTGKNGEDLIIKVPEGTVIYDDESGKVIADMSGDNMKETILKGGRGGKGNMNYATATMQAPQYAQPGQEAKELWVRLELKCIADVGLVGFPNVGKSTFLSRVTNARPKIANYHFTTLNPNLGVVDIDGGKGFVIADIPGLIEGASEGVGLGHQFLRHIERTKVIIHIVDAASTEGRDPIADIKAINAELEAYNPDLLKRPQVIAANKIDAIYDDGSGTNPVELIKAAFEPEGIKVYPISAVTGQGVKELLYAVRELLDNFPDDVVIFSSSPIPGNGASVSKTINKLYKKGVKVFTNAMSEIHSSGHANQEELKLMIRLFKPRYFVPYHGEFRMLKIHADLGVMCGVNKNNTFVLENGDVLNLRKGVVTPGGKVQAGEVYVDGSRIGEVGSAVIKDRILMSNNGILVIIANIDTENKVLLGTPAVTTRGYILVNENEDLIRDIQSISQGIINKCLKSKYFNYNDMKSEIINGLIPFLSDKTGRVPIILPIVMDVKTKKEN